MLSRRRYWPPTADQPISPLTVPDYLYLGVSLTVPVTGQTPGFPNCEKLVSISPHYMKIRVRMVPKHSDVSTAAWERGQSGRSEVERESVKAARRSQRDNAKKLVTR
jgi:hypothetical protein